MMGVSSQSQKTDDGMDNSECGLGKQKLSLSSEPGLKANAVHSDVDFTLTTSLAFQGQRCPFRC